MTLFLGLYVSVLLIFFIAVFYITLLHPLFNATSNFLSNYFLMAFHLSFLDVRNFKLSTELFCIVS